MRAEFGGIDLQASIVSYPEKLDTFSLRLNHELAVDAGERIPLFVKAVQQDGHMAWSSPVYVQLGER